MDWVKATVVGGGMGVLDDQLKSWDVRRGRVKAFQTATDIGRLAAVIGGAVLDQYGGKYARYGETLAVAAAPLLTQSLISAVRHGITSPVGNFTARRAFSSPVGIPVPSSGADSGIIVSST